MSATASSPTALSLASGGSSFADAAQTRLDEMGVRVHETGCEALPAPSNTCRPCVHPSVRAPWTRPPSEMDVQSGTPRALAVHGDVGDRAGRQSDRFLPEAGRGGEQQVQGEGDDPW
ncbi:hypothetical protein [Streptomyces sp. KL116D]|uniref:hypothetical protein n=1 Tax=Streptomyces sp. KL116D TaxID=3045152 RepID=UPI003556E8F9